MFVLVNAGGRHGGVVAAAAAAAAGTSTPHGALQRSIDRSNAPIPPQGQKGGESTARGSDNCQRTVLRWALLCRLGAKKIGWTLFQQ